MKRELKTTADGSHTLFVPDLNEHYHSTFGAIQEALHIFINEGLNSISKNEIKILEIGFGTGLNAFLTVLESEKNNKKIIYHSLEAFPLEMNLIETLNYSKLIDSTKDELFQSLHKCEWNKEVQIAENFTLKKIEADLVNFKYTDRYDLVYFDAFAPEIQPELWSESVFRNIFNALNDNGILVTYSSKGIVKTALRNAGFTVVRRKGPIGKRHILRAIKFL